MKDQGDKIVHLAEQMMHQQKLLASNTSSLEENTKLTRTISENTTELVDLFKGAKLFRKFLFWTSPFLLGIAWLWNWFFDWK